MACLPPLFSTIPSTNGVTNERIWPGIRQRFVVVLRGWLVTDSIFFSININSMISNLENMRMNLNAVRQRAENLNVRAPIDGQLGLLTPEIGQSIARGTNMGLINVLTSYKVTAHGLGTLYSKKESKNVQESFVPKN